MKSPGLVALLALISILCPHPGRSERASGTQWSEQLWSTGQQALQQKRPADALNPLQELIKKYPASPHFTEALAALGEAHLRFKQPEKAAPLLEQARRAWGISPKSWPPTLLLIETWLALGKPDRAALLAAELQNRTRALAATQPKAREAFQSALLYESEARIHLNQDERAWALLKNALLERPDLTQALQGREAWLKLRLHARNCQAQSSLRTDPKKPSKPGFLWPWLPKSKQPPRALDETGAFEQLDRISLCSRESVPLYLHAVRYDEPESRTRSQGEVHDLIRFWFARCSLAPLPHRRLAPDELARYREELAQEQRRRCRSQVKELLESLAKPKDPPILIQENLNSDATFRDDLREFIRRLAQENLGRLEP